MNNVNINNLITSAASDAISRTAAQTSGLHQKSTSDSIRKRPEKKIEKKIEQKIAKNSDAATRKSSVNSDKDIEKTKKERYNHMVDKSDDGDTLQISPEGNEDLSDGFVIRIKNAREKEEEQEDEDSKPSALESFESSLTSYKGISNEKLTQMYLQGIISQYDYQKEMDLRANIAEEKRNESSSASNTFSQLAADSSDIDETKNTIKAAYNGEAKDPKISTELIKAMENIKNPDNIQNIEQKLKIDVV